MSSVKCRCARGLHICPFFLLWLRVGLGRVQFVINLLWASAENSPVGPVGWAGREDTSLVGWSSCLPLKHAQQASRVPSPCLAGAGAGGRGVDLASLIHRYGREFIYTDVEVSGVPLLPWNPFFLFCK